MSVQEAFQNLANKNSDVRYLITEFDIRKNELNLVEVSEGSYDDMIGKLADDKLYFCIFKVYGVDERGDACTSKRDKIVAITWLGPSVSPLKRNAPLQSKTIRDSIFTGVVTEIQSDDKQFFSPQEIAQRLLAIGGAHKAAYYDFGGDIKVDVDFYKGSQ